MIKKKRTKVVAVHMTEANFKEVVREAKNLDISKSTYMLGLHLEAVSKKK